MMFTLPSESGVATATSYMNPAIPAIVCGTMLSIGIILSNTDILEITPRRSFESDTSFSTRLSFDNYYNSNSNLIWSELALLNMNVLSSLNQLDEISMLESNWNENGASPFSSALILQARALIQSLPFAPFVLPTGRDSIQMEYEKANGDYMELELFENGILKLFSLTSAGETKTENIDILSAYKVVSEFYE